MELSTHAKGVVTELAVQQAFIKHGFGVSVPVLPTSKYDMIADIDGNLFKVQIKTAKKLPDSDGFMIRTKSTRTHRYGVSVVKYTADEVDMFATCYNGDVYVVPQYLAQGTQFIFRNSSASNQKSGIHFASDFKLDNVVEKWRNQSLQFNNNQLYLNNIIL